MLQALIAGTTTSTIATTVAAANTYSSSSQINLYKELSEKYGDREAEVITEMKEDGLSDEEILSTPAVTNARQEYLEYELSKPKSQSNLESGIMSSATDQEIENAVKSVFGNRESELIDIFENSIEITGELETIPCMIPIYSENEKIESADYTPVFYTRSVSTSTYGLGSTNYKSTCGDLQPPEPGTPPGDDPIEELQRLHARAVGAIYGGGAVTIRHYAQIDGAAHQPGFQSVYLDCYLKGIAPAGSATISIVKRDSEGYIESEQVETVNNSIDKEINRQASFNFDEGDYVGIELYVEADGTAGAGMTDFYDGRTSTRYAEPQLTVET